MFLKEGIEVDGLCQGVDLALKDDWLVGLLLLKDEGFGLCFLHLLSSHYYSVYFDANF